MKNGFQLSPPQVLVIGFAFFILLGSLLLSLPIAVTDRYGALSYIDALFTATSAACLTGLVVVDTGTSFSSFGQVVIMMLIQIGGLGFMTMATMISFMFRRKISLKERLILQQSMNQGSMEGIVSLIRKVALYSLIIEGVAALIFTIRFAFDMSFGRAVYFAIFHAISLFNSAGFDLFGQFKSFSTYVSDPTVNIVSMLLIILGGIGFIVIADLIDFKKKKRLQLHSKVVLSVSAFLIVAGAIVIFVFEFTNPHTIGSVRGFGKVLASFFQSVSPRSGGTSTLDLGEFRQATQFFIIILMFIGASPGSTGGGIKTTTFAIMIGAMLAMLRGKNEIVLFRYRLSQDRILKATTLTLLAIFVVVCVSMILSITERHPFLSILFETTSAFGTVGASMGITPKLTDIGKILISITMFAGRLGPLTLGYAIQSKSSKELYRYPEGKITIG